MRRSPGNHSFLLLRISKAWLFNYRGVFFQAREIGNWYGRHRYLLCHRFGLLSYWHSGSGSGSRLVTACHFCLGRGFRVNISRHRLHLRLGLWFWLYRWRSRSALRVQAMGMQAQFQFRRVALPVQFLQRPVEPPQFLHWQPYQAQAEAEGCGSLGFEPHLQSASRHPQPRA